MGSRGECEPTETSEHAPLDEVRDRVLGSPEHDATVSVTESDNVGTWRDAGLRQQAEGQFDTALIVDMKFGWFPEHEESVAPSLSEDVDRLGL
ncbi:hypothetical protein [Streptomyces sp. NPDC088789]|uniref:hypothetical protein n=1 Tax=Streptomyces sp. NPDC088789 TaxID=3365899 RepID=UPI00380C6F38